jgi:hypothetical protein
VPVVLFVANPLIHYQAASNNSSISET